MKTASSSENWAASFRMSALLVAFNACTASAATIAHNEDGTISVSLVAENDTYVDPTNPDENYGYETLMKVSGPSASMVRFEDFSIPEGYKVKSFDIRVCFPSDTSSGVGISPIPQTIGDWEFDQVTANSVGSTVLNSLGVSTTVSMSQIEIGFNTFASTLGQVAMAEIWFDAGNPQNNGFFLHEQGIGNGPGETWAAQQSYAPNEIIEGELILEQITPVPEPSSALYGLLSLIALLRRKR